MQANNRPVLNCARMSSGNTRSLLLAANVLICFLLNFPFYGFVLFTRRFYVRNRARHEKEKRKNETSGLSILVSPPDKSIL